MTAQSLSSRALNRALLARHPLLERSRLGLTEALQQVLGPADDAAWAGRRYGSGQTTSVRS